MITAVHNRAGGAGPTLAEQAKLMQAMGCVNALNLDGGSSTSLYLSGQLLDRSPSTAARVQWHWYFSGREIKEVEGRG
jgi:exopolysaccharide biosynthesis protein